MVELGLLNTSSDCIHSLPGKRIQNIYLSKRENEILTYVTKGYNAKQIAKKLDISSRTVEQHVENIKFKMNVSSKAELIEKVMEDHV